ncbi:hypothetical protein [Cyanobacterium aponinum]|uniref:Uncharacterized protein n=1 Tax=Cyanobacterium aponinum 0216 TaxID=2676140 RepID=A0A844H0U0_9CHRO|nr:hypothetical protein [Cyanobacterium aponinum]MTF39985.1 hypothetical protein [Cyanobacterium aponinum 0216]
MMKTILKQLSLKQFALGMLTKWHCAIPKGTTTQYVLITVLQITSFLLQTPIAKADSPLTSTDLASAYQDLMVIDTIQEKQPLQGEALRFLLSNAPLDEKAAVINKLGWNIDGQNNGYIFLQALAKKKGVAVNNLVLTDLTPKDKFVLGYLLAMDDYFNLSPLDTNSNNNLFSTTPLDLLSQAAFAMPEDFTVHFIKSLVEAQLYFDVSWCAIYLTPQSVLRIFPTETRNLRPSAVSKTMEYINLYQDNCY